MKIKTFLIAFLTATFISAGAFAENNEEIGIGCNGKTVTYNDDGTVTLTWDDWDEGTTYNSLEEMYMDLYGFVPAATLAESGLGQYFNISSPNNNSNQSHNGLDRPRGRLIYSVKEATEVTKEGAVNKVRLRYR